MWRRTSRGCAGLVTAVLLAGCSSSPTSPAPTAPATPPVLLSTADLRLPLDDYQLSPADVRRLARTQRLLITQCLNTFGLNPVLPTPAEAGPRTANERRYGLTEENQVADGYWAGERTAPAPASTVDESVTAEVGAVVTGRGAQTVR